MSQIIYRGLLGGTHSWAVVGSELCNALVNLGYDISLQPTDKKQDIKPSLKPYMDGERKRAHVGIGYTIPRNLKAFNADRKVCIYNYETTLMPPGWVKDLNQHADLVLPSSNFAKNIFVQNGVLRNKLQVLPHGIDPNVYHPNVLPFNYGTDKFVFLCVAQPHARKGLDILLQAYAKEFASTENVCLVIKTSLTARRRAHYEIDVRELLNRVRKQYALPEVKIIADKFDDLAPLYAGADCFVLPTRSECFCLPALEAMACKLPVIITGYGGQTDFATRANSFLISYKMVNAPKSMQYWHFDPRGKIAEPDEDHLRVLMRYVFKDREETRKRAELAYEQAIPRFTWENVGDQLMGLVKQQNWAKRYKFTQSQTKTVTPDPSVVEQTRDKRYHRVISQRRERLSLLEQEIVTKQEEVSRLRQQLDAAKVIKEEQKYNNLTRPYSGKVSIIILSYNTKLATLACIDSIKARTRDIQYEIVVIDNGSTDGSVEALRNVTEITLLENAKNVGVSKGWNQGINAVDEKSDVVVLNSDIVVEEGWLVKLNRAAYSDPTIGVVGCRMKGHKNHAGHILHTGALIKKDGMGEENEWGIPLRDFGQYQINRKVQIVVGACMYLKREALEKVGLFDEQFTPAYFEDSDMCLKMEQGGYKVFYCGQVTLLHEHGATSRANNINAASLLATNRVKFVNKWGPYLSKKDGGVEIKGPIYGNSGYAEACRNLVSGLWENSVDVAFRPIVAHPSEQNLKFKNINLIAQDAISNPAQHDVGMVFYLADYFINQIQNKRRRIGYTMLEVDGVPANWVSYINSHLTELWVPSTFNQHTFKKSGVRIPIKVVPLGVDTNRFNPYVTPMLPKSDKFSFLCVCEWGERKNVHLLMRAFQAEFKKTEPVQLILRTGSHDPNVNVEKELSQYDLRNVVLLTQAYDSHQMPSLFKSADCFVLPSSGEGWGLPYAEAMACGLPVIGTAWSANLDFMNHENSYLLRAERIVPAVARCPLYIGFNWALPDLNHLRRLMRHVYENKEEARTKGEIASRHILSNYSLARTGEIAKSYLLG